MIAVRIPKEIKEYKEKLVFGLNVRQLISVVIALTICIPLYIFGRKIIGDELASWLVIFIALPCGGIGFIKYNGMVFEQLMLVILKHSVLFPMKRYFKINNFFEDLQNQCDDVESNSKKSKDKNNYALEKTFLLYEAEEKGMDINLEELDNKLNNKTTPPDKKNKGKKDKKRKSNNDEKSTLEIRAEEINLKLKENPKYLLSNKERKILLKYRNLIKNKRKQEIEKGKKVVGKKVSHLEKRRKVKTSIPKTTQDTIPYIADYEEGLFEIEPNKYSKVIRIKDINYLVAKEEEQISIFCKYGEFLNYFSEEMNVAITINNKVVSINEQEKQIFYPLKNDGYDRHRNEYNKILRKQIIAGRNDIQQQKYVTITIEADNPYEAILKFHKIEAEVITNLKRIGSDGKVLSTEERLSMLHDIFRKGLEGEFTIDYDFLKEQGLSSKDYIAPSSFYFGKNDFMIDDTYYKCMFLNNLPASLTDEFLAELVDCEFPLMTTLNIQPVAQDKGLRIVKRQLTGMEANKIEAEKKALRAGYSPETISHDLKQSLAQAEELLDDMMNKNQKMFFVAITVMFSGESKEDLEENCKILSNKARKYTCQLQNLAYQQEDAFKQTLPMGCKKLFINRTLTTESTSIFMPFASQELFQPGGFYYGLNQISRNLIMLDRTKMKTPSGFILGSSGSGKSFATKREILNVLLKDDVTNVLIIDPENEYGDFARAFGGEVIDISAESKNFINPLDLELGYSDDSSDPLTMKSEYIMSIVECMLSMGSNRESIITPQQKTIVDRCLRRCYENYISKGYDQNLIPTLLDLQNEFDKEKKFSEDGRQIAEGVEYYTKGSMNIFSHKSNVKYKNRLVVFNVRNLGNQLKQISLLITLDFIWNRMIANQEEGIRTYCYCDEIHTLFSNEFSARFLQQLYKRGRKYGLVMTGITQNMEDLLRSEMAKGMIGNSDFIMMLNQAPEDLKVLSNMLNISEAQMSYVNRADAGSGLLFAENTIVPFIDRFPTNSYLYKLMSTKFGEEDNAEDIENFIEEVMNEKTIVS